MDLIYFNLILIIALNILFFVSGICLNSLVIVSFWRLFYDYGFVLLWFGCGFNKTSIDDFLRNVMVQWNAQRILYTSLRSSVVFVAFSLNALVIMSFERYLRTSYPIFHRTSVTKAKLSTLFAIYTKYHDSPSLRFFIIFQRLCYFLRSFYSNRFHHSLSCHVVFQLQAVHGRQEKS